MFCLEARHNKCCGLLLFIAKTLSRPPNWMPCGLSRAGGRILLSDISNREEYLTEFKRLGCSDVRLVVSSVLRDSVNKMISFGSFKPASIVATKH